MKTPKWRCARLLAVVMMAGAVACDADPRAEKPAEPVQRSGQSASDRRKPAAVDTIRALLSATTRTAIQPRAGTAAQMVVLFIREKDVFTCEDLGRQSRDLRNWAAELGLPFLVWAEADADTRIPVFLRREHIPHNAVFLTRSPLEMQTAAEIHSPAAMLVNMVSGEIQGFAHPERVANVRQRSFAHELRDIYRS